MGQYQQWLLAQEIDRRLKAEIESLETELTYLKERATILEQSAPGAEHVILRALLAAMHQQPRPQETPEAPQVADASELTAEDILTFFKTHSPQAPVNTIEPFNSPQDPASSETHPVDEETRRLNESIQRWFERWQQQMTNGAQMEEVRHE